MLNLENWAQSECQLGNIAKRAQQFNLLGEERRSEGKKGEEKKWEKIKRGEGREKRKGGGGKGVRKREKIKYRKAKMNRCMWKRFIYIQQKLWLVKDYRKEYRRLTWLTRKTKSDINQFNQLILISTNISQKQN